MTESTEEFARPARSSPLGKCTTRVDIPCAEKLKDDLTGLAFLHRQTVSEYVREVLEEHVYGKQIILDRVGRHRPGGDGSNNG